MLSLQISDSSTYICSVH
uniref:Uncharacterized protein n=1 Tax=Arundo donax TaxID=35708 RepID=A0A0A9GV95_ARUDO